MGSKDFSLRADLKTKVFTTDEEIAGEDTTANTLNWMLYYLCLYLDVQRKMQVEAMLGADALLWDWPNADKPHCSDAVANAITRLRPVAPFYFT